MARLAIASLALGFCALLCYRATACSLCTSPIRKETLGQELERADLIFFGYATNPRLSALPGALPGSGSTDFHIEKVIKRSDALGQASVLSLDRYLPVLDPKDPPHFLMFCNVVKGKIDPYLGKQIKNRAVLDYLEKSRAERARGKVEALQYYARFFDDPDDLIAEDAFLEFARSSDIEVGQAAKKLDPVRLRALLQNPKLDPDRTSLFAFLLGSCGDDKDALMLRKRIEQTHTNDSRALDGFLGGYIALRPREGWKLTCDILTDRGSGFLKKYAALRTVRFYMGSQPAESRAPMFAAYKLVVPDGDMADLAIEDLRRWKIWDLTPLVLAQYGKATHAAPIVKRGIVRYALCCPLPEAARFLDGVRSQDPRLVAELTEALEFEKKN